MKLGPLVFGSDLHVVTSVEVSYETLFGLLVPRKGFLYLPNITSDIRLDWEEWLVDSMDVHHADSTGRLRQGRHIPLFAVQPAGTGPVDLPSTDYQFGHSRVRLLRPTATGYGVGYRCRQTTAGLNFLEGDLIQMSVGYRKVLK